MSYRHDVAIDLPGGEGRRESGPAAPHASAAESSRSCGTCRLKGLCLPRSLDRGALEELDRIVGSRTLQRNEVLYRSGDPLKSVYVPRSGSLKMHIGDASGVEQVVGFYLPAELVGLDALHKRRHSTTTVALETSNVCKIPYARLEELCAVIPRLNHQFARLMGREVSSEHQLLLSLGRRDLEQRLAVFLLDLSQRWRSLGFSAARFRLTMRRDHIASYLGSSSESISRTFTRLRDLGVLTLRGKEVNLVDIPRLIELSGAPAEFQNLLSAG